MIDCRIFLAFLFLFSQSVTVQSADFTTGIVPTSYVSTTSGTTLATKKGNEITAKSITTGDRMMSTVSVSESTSTPITKHSLGLLSSLPSKQPPVVIQVATTHEKKSALDVTTTTVSNATKEPGSKLTTDILGLGITATQKTVETQTDATTISGTSATTTISNATIVVPKVLLTSDVLTTSSEIRSTPKSLRPRSKGRPGQSTGKGLITTTRIDVLESTDLEKITEVPGPTEPSSVPRKHDVVLIVAIVLFFLFVLVLVVACLYCRRRRRSGSTSFNAAGWAGQAALPDDTGLDKDVEQGLSGSGERETRRATLTTFFGKRQSRVASIAMEEIDGKEKEEAQQLIDGDDRRKSSVQGSGEANGKVPE